MKRVLLIAATTGYQIRAFGEAARAAGTMLIFASDRCDQLKDPWCDQAIPVRFHDEEGSVRAVREALDANPPDGIVAVGDRPVALAARLNELWGLPGNPPAAAVASRNKLASRVAFSRAGLLVPAFKPISIHDNPLDVVMTYPAVLKPLALSGSRGVIRVNNSDEFVVAFHRLRGLLAAADVRAERDPVHDALLAESFIPGRECAIEGVLTSGVLRVLAIFDKPDPLVGPYFEETIYVTPSRQPGDVQRRMTVAVASAAAALGLRHGPIHAECRINELGVYVLEAAARPIGGLCSRALAFESNAGGRASLEELLLRHAMQEDVSRFRREPKATGVMMIPIPRRGVLRGVEGVDAARRVRHVTDVQITMKQDAIVVPLPEGRSYLGFIFARAAEPPDVVRALRTAHMELDFLIDNEINLVSSV